VANHIRYVIDAYTTSTFTPNDIQRRLPIKLDQDVRINKRGHRVITITFRTPEDQRILGCGEIDEILLGLGISAFRIIISRVITYEIEGGVIGSSAGGTGSYAYTKKPDVSLLIAVLSGVAGYLVGSTVERVEKILKVCRKRNGIWENLSENE